MNGCDLSCSRDRRVLSAVRTALNDAGRLLPWRPEAARTDILLCLMQVLAIAKKLCSVPERVLAIRA